MIVNEDRIQTYLDKKGWVSVADDVSWEKCLKELKEHFGGKLWMRVKTIIQSELPMGMGSWCSPEHVPTPYRFLDWIEFGAFLKEEETEIETVKQIAISNGIIFERIWKEHWIYVEGDEELRPGWSVKYRGFKETIAQQDGSGNLAPRLD